MSEDTELLRQIRNALRFLVSTHFSDRSVPEEGGPSMEQQDRFAKENIDGIMKTDRIE